MSRWGTMDGVADLPERAFNENKFERTYEGGGGSRSAPSPTFGPGMTAAQSAQLAQVSSGTPAPTAPAITAATPYQAAQMGSTNPYQQAAGAQQAALTGMAGAGTIAGQTSAANIGQYMNPYTQQVINATQQDIMRGAQQGLNALGTQASRAGAFGGSRHGVAMAELGTGVAQQLGAVSAQQRQAAFQNAQNMAQQDIQNRMAQAQGLAGLGQQSFGYGQTINQGLQQQGAQQQAMQQALIDAAKQQFAAYTGQPMASLGTVSAALGATPMAQNTQTTKTPGLFDYLTLAASVMPKSDIRLKKNIKRKLTLPNGINVYTWDWTELGEKLKKPYQAAQGVIAQEVMKRVPEAVKMASDGFYGVDYSHPELAGAM